jgi:hypothetical protein
MALRPEESQYLVLLMSSMMRLFDPLLRWINKPLSSGALLESSLSTFE